jgi:cellobiose phosphorylase
MFSHMAVMYAYALYQRGKVKEGFKVLEGIFQHCQNFERSRIFPGIPEYINERGRGMYTYLTGSASWYLLTLVTEAFGVRGRLGDLVLEPKLMAKQFNREGKARLITRFADRKMEIIYHNRALADFGDYIVRSVSLDGRTIKYTDFPVIIPRSQLSALDQAMTHRIEVEL